MSARCNFYRVNVDAVRASLQGDGSKIRSAIEKRIATSGDLSDHGREELTEIVRKIFDEHDFACHGCGEIYGVFTDLVSSKVLSDEYPAWPLLDDFSGAAEYWPISDASKEVLQRLPSGRTPFYESIGERDRGTTITSFISPEEAAVLLEEFGDGEFWEDEDLLEEALEGCATDPEEMYEFINECFLHALEMAELGECDCIVLVICP